MIKRFESFSQAIFNITRYWNQIAGEEMRRHGLKGAYAIYLVTMHQEPRGVTAAELVKLCGKDKADVSRAVSVMESEGLLERKGENTYRARLVLTAKGEEIARQLDRRAILAVEMAGKGVSDADRQVFYETLATIANNIQRISIEGLPRSEEARTGEMK